MLDARTYVYTGHHEGKVLKAYRCPAGVVTIGYGFTIGSKVFAAFWRAKTGRGLRLGDTISDLDAMMLLKRLMDAEYGEPVERLVPNALPHQKGAAVDTLFNCGLGAVKWRWFGMLEKGLPREAANALRTTAVTAKGRRLPGLARRRAESADIMAFNRWPAWLKAPATSAPAAIEAALPTRALESDDFHQGVVWLEELGYLRREAATERSHRPTDITAAVVRFQGDHKQLTNDGILGRATLDQLQRVVDLKRKLKGAAGSGAAVSTAGAADKVADASGYADWIVYGGMAFVVIGCAVLAWMYRDELKAAFGRTAA